MIRILLVLYGVLISNAFAGEEPQQKMSRAERAATLARQYADIGYTTISSGPGPFGTWGYNDFCPLGSFVYGFRIKYEGYQGDGDDTAANGIQLSCRDQTTGTQTAIVSSTTERFGDWTAWQECPAGHYVFGFQNRIERRLGDEKDDTGMNGIKLNCRPYRSADSQPSKQLRFDGDFGDWAAESSCPGNQIVAGLASKVEGYGGGGNDDTSLNEVRLYCSSPK